MCFNLIALSTDVAFDLETWGTRRRGELEKGNEKWRIGKGRRIFRELVDLAHAGDAKSKKNLNID